MPIVVAAKMFSFDPQCICMILAVFYVPVTSVNSIHLAIFVIRWGCVLCEVRSAVFFLYIIGNTYHTCVVILSQKYAGSKRKSLQNNDNENFGGVGLGQTQRRRRKRLRHCGCEAWHSSRDWDAGVVCSVS